MERSERVLIVGGGIAGLALANGLRRLGINPTIVEQAPQFGAVGAGIALSVNAMAALRYLGLDEATQNAGRRLDAAEVTDAHGRCLSRVSFKKLAKEFGPTITIHRAALHEILLAECGDIPLLCATTVNRLNDQGGVVSVEFSNGARADFDWVIGADGIHSRTRAQVFGETKPRYSGYTCWRFVVDRPAGLDRTQEMWGRGLRFGLVPLADERLYCFTCANAPEATPDPVAGRVERFQNRFSEFGGFAPQAIEQIKSAEQLIHNDLAEMPKHPWYKGKVLLIGDAGHATTPNMGQGAAMAIEDAAVLCAMLKDANPGRSFAEIMPAFVARREPRVRFIVDQSRRIGRIGQMENSALIALRNFSLRAVPDRMAEAGAHRAAAAKP